LIDAYRRAMAGMPATDAESIFAKAARRVYRL
jgi:predicted TIM-barrel fold metal-dependent hydrolase